MEQVFGRLNRRPRLAAVWGGAAIAALFIGALSSGRVFPSTCSITPAAASRTTNGCLEHTGCKNSLKQQWLTKAS